MSKQEGSAEQNWYAIHTYVGYENAVMRNLKQRIESLGMEDKIFNVIVPTEKKIKIKGGKRVPVEEKIYPGYVLVDMIVNDDSWYVVRNTPRVTGFVGAGVHPVPLSKEEVDSLFKRMNTDTVKHKITFRWAIRSSLLTDHLKTWRVKSARLTRNAEGSRYWYQCSVVRPPLNLISFK